MRNPFKNPLDEAVNKLDISSKNKKKIQRIINKHEKLKHVLTEYLDEQKRSLEEFEEVYGAIKYKHSKGKIAAWRGIMNQRLVQLVKEAGWTGENYRIRKDLDGHLKLKYKDTPELAEFLEIVELRNKLLKEFIENTIEKVPEQAREQKEILNEIKNVVKKTNNEYYKERFEGPGGGVALLFSATTLCFVMTAIVSQQLQIPLIGTAFSIVSLFAIGLPLFKKKKADDLSMKVKNVLEDIK
jgi:hypothetical protein